MITKTARYKMTVDGAALVFTNSERSALICPRFYAYQHIQNVENSTRAAALSYGSIAHLFLEEVLRSVMANDAVPSLVELLAIHRAKTPQFIQEEATAAQVYIDPDPIMANIEKSLIGWRNNFVKLMNDWEVIGVELEFVAPILNRQDQPLIRTLPVVLFKYDDGREWARPARAGEALRTSGGYELNLSNAELERAKDCARIQVREWEMPLMIAGKVDALLRNRTDPTKLAVLDHKTTSSLAKYTKNAKYDIQLPTYAYLVQHGTNQHGTRVSGNVGAVFYDLLHSKIPDPPKPLKSGKLSKARVGCPSWIYRQAISDNNLSVEDYADTLAELELNTDRKYFDIIRRDMFPDDVDRCKGELFGVATEIADRRSRLAAADLSDDFAVDSIVPRQPHQCILWGDCKFSQICIANNQFNVILSSEPTIWFENPNQ